MKRTFLYQRDGSNKFWDVQVVGYTVTTYWGKIGTKPQSSSTVYDNASKAQFAFLKLISSKLVKGYRETTDAPKKIQRNTSTPEGKAFWDSVEKSAKLAPKKPKPAESRSRAVPVPKTEAGAASPKDPRFANLDFDD